MARTAHSLGRTLASEALRALLTPLPPPSGITQTQLAVQLGVTRQLVAQWLDGTSVPHPRAMAEIEALGVPMRDWARPLPPTTDPEPAQ